MRRYWVDEKYFNQDTVVLADDVFHHICEVCRQGLGNKFEVLSNGKAYLVEIVDLHKKKAFAQIIETREVPELPKPLIKLAVSLPKFATFENILEKSVELGVAEVLPFVSDYSFLRDANSSKISNKQQRWQKIIRSATQQSGRGELLQLKQTTNLRNILENFNRNANAVGLFAYEGECKRTLHEEVASWKGQGFEELWLFVGSEGGFSIQEVEKFQAYKLNPVTLGDQVLRVETACLALVSILKYEVGHF